jgi:glutamate/tyrosine decarboxylase-like PLP-dependent enzyme
VNSGAFDFFSPVIDAAHEAGAWVHVDGAFGLWAAVSPERRRLMAGAERADSWSTDAHKWLNVPYDSGVAIVADRGAHCGSMATSAAYLLKSDAGRDPLDYAPEFSRRARGFAVYAALRSLGRTGVRELVDRCCGHARLIADRLAADSRCKILNEVVLNQVLVAIEPPAGTPADAFLDRVAARARASGEIWVGGTLWRGQPALRVSFVNASTSDADVERGAAAILRAVHDLT